MDIALQKLGFTSIDGITSDSLKRAFKAAVVNAHPDKGGSDDDFESILSAYVHLSAVIKRLSGGRDGFQILDPSDVKQARDDQFTSELNNLVSEIFDQIDHTDHSTFQKEFNEQFEANHVRENDRGYEEWFRSKIDIEDQKIEESDPDTWNRAFESNVKLGKPEPTTLILHPDQMAFISGSTRGTALIPSSDHSFTSDVEERPEYTDLHDAYTSENTVFDKVPIYQEKQRTFEDLLKERDMVYVSELDRDLEAIAAYEKRVQEEEKEHKRKIEEYFKGTASSVWALRSVRSVQSVDADSSESFVKEFK
jgi:curved DNA-binding protein CbpA